MTAIRLSSPRWTPTPSGTGRFGFGKSERCIEAPWAEAWLQDRRAILDVGFALSDLSWLRTLLGVRAAGAELTAVDIIAPERVANRYPDDLREAALATPVIHGDVRTAPVPPAAFDAVTCISTIEHIGFDAAGSTADSAFARWRTLEETPDARDPQVTRDGLAAFARALKPGGVALISVPMGKGGAVPVRDSLGFYTRQLEYDAETWRDIAEAPGFRLLEQRFFTWIGEGEGAWEEAAGPDGLAHQSAWLTPHATGVALAALERVG
jgi:SAM-dependent methyltransferase